MSQIVDLNNVLPTIITLLLGFIVFYVIWQNYVIDETRQKLFELRDGLFDLASEGKLDFNSEVYIVIRSMFNSTIRFAHELDWVHLVFFLLVSKIKKGNLSKSALHVEHLVKNIDDIHVRQKVDKILQGMYTATAWLVFRRSLLLILLMPVLIILVSFLVVGDQFLSKTPRKFRTLLNAKAYSGI